MEGGGGGGRKVPAAHNSKTNEIWWGSRELETIGVVQLAYDVIITS